MKSSSRRRPVRSLKAKAATADAAELDSYGSEPNMKLSHAFMVVLALHIVAVGGLFAFNKVKAGHSKASEKLKTEIAAGQESLAKEESKPMVAAAAPAVAPTPVHQVEKEIAAPAAPALKAAPKIAEAPVTPQKLQEPIAPAPAKQMVSQPAPAPAKPALTAAQKEFLATKSTAVSTTAAATVSAPTAVATVASMVPSTATAVETAPVAVPETSNAIEYTIVKGDNPYKIAKRFHVPYDQLIKFNNISDPRKMQIGQKIRIPKKS